MDLKNTFKKETDKDVEIVKLISCSAIKMVNPQYVKWLEEKLIETNKRLSKISTLCKLKDN